MEPFDEHWIHQIERQYGLKHRWEQPDIYRIATNANMWAARTLANRFVDSLPDEAQAKLVSKLRKDKSFSDAFHEIVVGAMLTKCGPIPDYEPELTTGKTPDWYVAPRGGEIGCTVEVVSRNTADRVGKRSLDELLLRLRQIPLQAALSLGFVSDDSDPLPSNPKQVASDVQKWLEASDTAPQSTLLRDGVLFTVLSMNTGIETVNTIIDPVAFRVDSHALSKLIASKVQKYAGICQNGGSALVVAVVADPVTGLDTEDVESVLFGSVKYPIAVDKTTKRPLLKQPYRSHDGIFEHYLGLSAVAWVVQNGPDTWTSTLYRNPACNILLPDQVLKGMQSTLAIARQPDCSTAKQLIASAAVGAHARSIF